MSDNDFFDVHSFDMNCRTCGGMCNYGLVEAMPKTGHDVVKPMVNEFVHVQPTRPLTGWSSDYYKLHIDHPTEPGRAPYDTECNDIIEALGLNFAEGNVLKALWRKANARKGNGKKGNTPIYDAQKIAYYGARLVEQEKAAQ